MGRLEIECLWLVGSWVSACGNGGGLVLDMETSELGVGVWISYRHFSRRRGASASHGRNTEYFRIIPSPDFLSHPM